MGLASDGNYPHYMPGTYGAEVQETPFTQEEFQPEKTIWGYEPSRPFSMEEARGEYEREAGRNEARSRASIPSGVIWRSGEGINCNTDPHDLDTEQLKYYLVMCKGKRQEDVEGASRHLLLSML
jgi:hypothetical protein